MEGKLDWGKYFDRVVCVHYKPYDNRLPRLYDELTRVGLINSPLFQMSVIDSIDGVDSYHNLGFHTARVMDSFLDTPGKRLCVLENDVAFLKDLSLLADIFDDLPDTGLAQLDKFCPWSWGTETYRKFVEDNRVSKHFFCTDQVRFSRAEYLAGASFYTVDRDAAYKLRTHMINNPGYPDPRFKHLGVPLYTSDINGAVQIMFDTGASAPKWCYENGERTRNSHTLGYASIGLSYDDYAVPEGYNSDTLFYAT